MNRLRMNRFRLANREERMERRKRRFNNESSLKFTDISSERYRWYIFPNGKGVTIRNPIYLNVSKNGGHRVYDYQGNSWYVRPNQSWYMKWRCRKNRPNFVK